MTTYLPAKEFGLLDKYGRVAPGKVANLILIDGDPKKDIKDIRKIYLTFKEVRFFRQKGFLQLTDGSIYY